MSDTPVIVPPINIYFHIEEVMALFGLVLESVSGAGLERFLVEEAGPWFENDISDRFHEEGDVRAGFWPPLKESTQRIRASRGFDPTEPINIRTDELYQFVVNHRSYSFGPDFAMMEVPGDPPDPLTAKKLLTAQRGDANNPSFPSAYTPPRPVLAADEGTLEIMLELLIGHVIEHVVAGSHAGMI